MLFLGMMMRLESCKKGMRVRWVQGISGVRTGTVKAVIEQGASAHLAMAKEGFHPGKVVDVSRYSRALVLVDGGGCGTPKIEILTQTR